MRIHPMAPVLGALITLLACRGEVVQQQSAERGKANMASAAPATGSRASGAEAWSRVASRTVFFGHQSVGGNLIDGMRDLMRENPSLKLNIVRGASPRAVEGPAFIETPIGDNGDPARKVADFERALAGTAPLDSGIALMKFCYLDVTPSTDVDSLFATYRAGIGRVRQAQPSLRLVHVTPPLTVSDPWAKGVVKRVLGRPTAHDLNAKRNRLGELMRREFGSRDAIFDLARIESTRADGSRSFVARGGDTTYTLAPEYTDDGGHLNPAGRRIAAAALLDVLAGL